MAIRIDKITNGRFGNKILQYSNLMQISNNYKIKASCCKWEGNQFFKNITPYIPSKKNKRLLFCKKIIENEKLDFNNFDYILDDPASCLHNVLPHVTKTDPREFLELKDEYKPKLSDNIIHIGIHCRGGDKLQVSKREIHNYKYYEDSINYVKNNFINNNNYIFIICTDDITFFVFKKICSYLKDNNIIYKMGPATQNTKQHYIHDWSILSECDIFINNSSTFCVTAGFLGKKKKIIYSKEWIDKNIYHTLWNNDMNSKIEDYNIIDFRHTFDNFWINVSNNNSNYYYATLLI
tara:strand:- start:733 stop:1611 length:879 start_codon:yes stop_codon:yes gene_type:complete